MAYANVSCTDCDTPYWYGSLMSIWDEPDFDNTGSEARCPKCGSTNRRDYPRIALSPVVSTRCDINDHVWSLHPVRIGARKCDRCGLKQGNWPVEEIT